MASKRRLRRKACDGKVRFVDVATAKKTRHYLKWDGKRINVYHCSFCHGYHIGHAPLKLVNGY